MRLKTKLTECIGWTIIILVLLFVIAGNCYVNQIQEVFKQPVLVLPWTTIDWWSISHFTFYFILSFLYPHYICTFFVGSVIWEIVEDALAPTHSKVLVDCSVTYENSWIDTFKTVWCNHTAREKDYWYGKWDDIIMNSLGLIAGFACRMSIAKHF